MSAQAPSSFRAAAIHERFDMNMVVDRVNAAESLLERDEELRLIAGQVDRAAAGEGGLLVVQGHAGVGKTELLRAAGELGEAAGLRVLRGRGSELDRAFAFGVVRQLLEREVADSPDLLTGGAEAAEAVFALARGGDARAEEGLFAALQGLQWLVANLAARTPLLVIADDIHWADSPSLRWLVFLAERIEDVAALLVVATRPAEPGADQELLDALMVAPAAHVLRPPPLSEAATTTVVRSRLPDAVDTFTAACHRATGGNPFLLGELLSELAADRVAGAAEEAQTVLEFGPERVGRAVRRRMRQLPAEATDLARAVAILGPGTPLEEAAELAGCNVETGAKVADALVGINVLAADRALDFVHPVVLSAVYDQIPPLECQTLHVAAAEQLMAHGVEMERVAQHLLRLPPSGRAARVALLRAAARDASARGAAEAAARYLRRALEEPPPSEERAAVLYELGVAEATDRQSAWFDPHLREALALTSEPRGRAEIALALGSALAASGSFRASVDVLDNALRGLEDPDDELAVALEAELLSMAFHEFTATELAAPRWERRFAQLDAGEELDPRTLACLVVAIAGARGPAARAINLAERVLELSRLDHPNSVVSGCLGNGLIYAGAPSRAARFYDQTSAIAMRRGSRLTVAWQATMRAEASLRLGEIRRAEAEARFGFEHFAEGGGEPGFAWCLAHVLNALTAAGALDEAEQLADSAPIRPAAAPTFPLALLLTSRANIHLARGRANAALSEARAAGDIASPAISNPDCIGWRAPAALALAVLERPDAARALADDALADARRFAIPDAEGSALRTVGLVAGGPEGLEALRASVDILERGEGRLEHARSRLELGSALRRAGERVEARTVLRDALDAAARMGATAVADRAHEELVAAGARPRRDRRMLTGRESLTASEDRVAALAAEGLTNREIAQRQFVTVKAVEWHLRNVYRKLDIASREQLPEALGVTPAQNTGGDRLVP
jgi:DNA-binding CsgD family transcriptional regulator